MNCLENDKIPWIDKYELEDKYKEIRKNLTSLSKPDENVTQNHDMKNMLKVVQCQKRQFNQTKNKHDKLIKHFKSHRIHFLSYIWGLFSCCTNNSKLSNKPCSSEKLRFTETELPKGAK